MLKYVDTHCHLDLKQFDADVSQVIKSAEQAGVDILINPAIDLASSQRIVDLCKQYEPVYGAVGIHPNDIQSGYSNDIEKLRGYCDLTKVIAIGEIGLDYYHKDVPVDIQLIVFKLQLDLAAQMSIPVIVHSRDAIQDVVDILTSWSKFQHNSLQNRYLGVLHAYEGDPETALKLYDLGFMIGIGGPITYKNAELKRSVISRLPLEALLLETDSPFLSPEPHRGTRNEPAYIPLIGMRTAIIKEITEDEVASVTTRNALRLFHIGAVH